MRKKCIHAQARKRGPYPKPMKERVDFEMSPAAREKAQMRHRWYRKQKQAAA